MFRIFLIFTGILFQTICLAQRVNPSLRMVRIPSGTFVMGNDRKLPDSILPGDNYSDLSYLSYGDADEQPLRKVLISAAFDISETEITVEQYRQFDSSYQAPAGQTYATGINWYQANAFCTWLGKKEGKTYRLPTEAEWEYIAQLESREGKRLVKNLFEGPAEWCLDWYASYPDQESRDPMGTKHGLTKVIRGGGLDQNGPFFLRAANRASMPPSFPPEYNSHYRQRIAPQMSDSVRMPINKGAELLGAETLYMNFIRNSSNNQGNHHVGFRVVCSPAKLMPFEMKQPFPLQMVKEKNMAVLSSRNTPFFRKRDVLPTPMDDAADSLTAYYPSIGLERGLLSHNHSPALEVMPNGDVLMVIYTSVSETAHDVKLMVSRLRLGSDQWDMPAVLVDCADANDHAPLLWQDADTTWLFWGNNKFESSFPFQWMKSFDNGQNWTTPAYPEFRTPVYAHSAQPITSAFRDENGIIYVGSDGIGPSSVLWRSEDNGKTWIDPVGRTNGRHSAFIPLKDGSIMALGGKNTHLQGKMPKAVSRDKGVTWELSSTPFTPLGSGQRPSMIRLKSGRILASGDFSSRLGKLPASVGNNPQKGCYVAWSDDEGENWNIKKLPATQFGNITNDRMKDHTLGYSVLRQGPNGNIHLLATVVHPVLAYEFNEAWLLSGDTLTNAAPDASAPIINRKNVKEFHPNGKLKASYGWAILKDGSAWLDGKEQWFGVDGKPVYQAFHQMGRKKGDEVLMDAKGQRIWHWQHSDTSDKFQTYWHNGKLKTQSTWQGKFCEGPTSSYHADGRLQDSLHFQQGTLEKIIIPLKSTLEQDFTDPPTAAKPYVWWHWMGSNFSTAGITKDLEAMKEMGIGGATIFNIASAVQESHVPTLNNPWPEQTYRSPAYWKAIAHAAAEAERLGLEIGLHNTAGYSTTGGPWITEERAMQRLVWSKVQVEGGKWVQQTLSQGEPPIFEGWGSMKQKANFYKDIAVLAIPADSLCNTGQVLNITANMNANGDLHWNAPAGKWIIYRVGHAPTMANPHPLPDDIIGKSLEVDKMSREQNIYHWNQVIQPLKTHLGKHLGKSFKHLLIDSYEADMQNWTPTFREEFMQRKGYDPLPWILTFDKDKSGRGPVLNSMAETQSFANDFNDVVDQLFFDNGWKIGKQMIHEAGLQLQFEPYTGPFSTIRGASLADVPMGEFWTHLPGINIQIPAAAHAAGRKIVGAEAFTGWPMNSQYTEDPEFLKPTSTWAFATGVNRLILHTWVHQPFEDKYQPGMSMGWWGTHFGRHQTWFEPGKAFFKYLARAQVMLQYGEPVSDALREGAVKNLQEDAIDKHDDMKRQMTTGNGQITLPSGRTYPMAPRAPDFIIEQEDTASMVRILHRTGKDGDVYFVANLHRKPQHIRISFRQQGLQPELWNAEDGSLTHAAIWEQKDGRTSVEMTLSDFQTMFVVFRHPILPGNHPIRRKNNQVSYADGSRRILPESSIKTIPLAGSWQVMMKPKLDNPFSMRMNGLSDWGKSSDKRIRFFAGTGTYVKTVDIPAALKKDSIAVLLDMGSVHDIVSVKVNGHDLGVVWYPPYRLDISQGMHAGSNRIEISVTNNWANRLIGDEEEPADFEWGADREAFGRAIKAYPEWFLKDRPRPSQGRKTFSIWYYYRKDDNTKPAGLLGPVNLLFQRKEYL